MALNEDGTEFAMSLAAPLAAAEIAAALKCDTTEALGLLLASRTGAELYDDSLKLWWESPMTIAEMFLAEQDGGRQDNGRDNGE